MKHVPAIRPAPSLQAIADALQAPRPGGWSDGRA
jgi:hypothetical protein